MLKLPLSEAIIKQKTIIAVSKSSWAIGSSQREHFSMVPSAYMSTSACSSFRLDIAFYSENHGLKSQTIGVI